MFLAPYCVNTERATAKAHTEWSKQPVILWLTCFKETRFPICLANVQVEVSKHRSLVYDGGASQAG